MNPAEDRLAELEAVNAALRAQVSELPILRAQITALLAEVEELRGQLAKDSHHSHKPPRPVTACNGSRAANAGRVGGRWAGSWGIAVERSYLSI
jgi:hypothetical protein